MDASVSDANHLDADVLLPPRKRLLAGLKRQSYSQSTSQCSHENNQSPSPSSQAVPLTEFDIRLNNLLRTYKNGSNTSPEEIAKVARSAAVSAAKSAEAARAIAEEKAAIAAKAVSSAKRALDLVASIVEDKQQRKNKSKKQVPVQVLYENYQSVEKSGKDEELATGNIHKKLKTAPTNEKNGIDNGKSVRDDNLKLSLARNDDNEETLSVEIDRNCDEIEVNSCGVKSSHPKKKASRPLEDICINGRKRGRIKQKKLPLSICSFKDQAKPNESNVKRSLFSPARVDKSTTHHVSSLSMGCSGNVKTI